MSVTFNEQLRAFDEHQQAADALAAAVIKRAEGAGVVISGQIRKESLALMTELISAETPPEQLLRRFMPAFIKILRKYEPSFARLITDAQLASWLQGGQSVLNGLPAESMPPRFVGPVGPRNTSSADEPPEPPEWMPKSRPGEAEPVIRFPIIDAAAKELAARNLIMSQDFFAVLGQNRVDGFRMARGACLDALEKIRDGLTAAVVEGHSLATFKKHAAEALDASGLSPSRQERMFRDALNTSYARGQKRIVEHPLVRSVAMFAWRSEIQDGRLTPLCNHLSHSGLQGTAIYCTEDPVWRKVAPISHRGCRCGTIFISIERAAQKGIRVAQKWLQDAQRPSDDELFVSPIVIPPGLLTASELSAWEAWESPWAA